MKETLKQETSTLVVSQHKDLKHCHEEENIPSNFD